MSRGVLKGSRSTLIGSSRGVVSVEVLLALVPLLLTFLGVIQLALFEMGQLVVTHAANRAVRSAIVVLDDDPKYYGGVGRYDLHSGAMSEKDGLLGELGALNEIYTAKMHDEKVIGGARLTAIRQAAYHPLSALAPGVASGTVNQEIGQSHWARMTAVAYLYNRAAAAITVEPQGPLGPRDPVTVEVNYLMKCGVPLVSRLMCHSGHDIFASALPFGLSETHEAIMSAMKGVASPTMRDALLLTGARFRLLSARATLPNQGARYHED